MRIKVNISGTGNHKGQDKIRLDLIPETFEKSYARNHVFVPVVPEGGYPGPTDEQGQPVDRENFESWLAGLPHIWQLNPCLSIFVGVDENITAKLLEEFISDVYTPDVLATIDNIMSAPLTNDPHLHAHLISPYARGKTTLSGKRHTSFDKDTKNYIDRMVGGVSLLLPSDGKALFVTKQSIDVGPGATDRAALEGAPYTMICLDNPANADGYLNTFQFWFVSTATGVKGGTFQGSGTTYTSRDYEAIGNVSSGSVQTFTGLNCDVITGDFLGSFFTSGTIESAATGYTGLPYKAGDQFGAGEQTYSAFAGHTNSIYATGVEVFNLSATDGLKVGGSRTASMAASVSRTDGVKAAGTSTGPSTSEVTRTEALALNSLAVIAIAYFKALNEGLKVGSSNAANMAAFPTVTDGVKIDGARLIESLAEVLRTDGVKLSDAALVGFLAALSRTDGLEIGSAESQTMVAPLSVTDGITLADTVIAEMEAIIARVEGLKLADSSGIVILRLLYMTLQLNRRNLELELNRRNITLRTDTL
ncbi:MAG: hypothetical protein WC329_01635 [Candidatus Omnitrophota bacterium]|jgi:hypothetical protein